MSDKFHRNICKYDQIIPSLNIHKGKRIYLEATSQSKYEANLFNLYIFFSSIFYLLLNVFETVKVECSYHNKEYIF